MSGNYDIIIEQGVRFYRPFRWVDGAGDPVDLTGVIARMEIRTRDRILLATPSCEVEELEGTVTVSLTTEQTEALDFDTAVYDIELSRNGEVIKRLLKGMVILDRETTEDV